MRAHKRSNRALPTPAAPRRGANPWCPLAAAAILAVGMTARAHQIPHELIRSALQQAGHALTRGVEAEASSWHAKHSFHHTVRCRTPRARATSSDEPAHWEYCMTIRVCGSPAGARAALDHQLSFPNIGYRSTTFQGRPAAMTTKPVTTCGLSILSWQADRYLFSIEAVNRPPEIAANTLWRCARDVGLISPTPTPPEDQSISRPSDDGPAPAPAKKKLSQDSAVKSAILCEGLDSAQRPKQVSQHFPKGTNVIGLYVKVVDAPADTSFDLQWYRGEHLLCQHTVRLSGDKKFIYRLRTDSVDGFSPGSYIAQIKQEDRLVASIPFTVE